MADWLVILAEYAAAAGFVYFVALLFSNRPATGYNEAVAGGFLLAMVVGVLIGGLVAAPIVHAVLGRRDRRNPRRPSPRGPFGAATRAVKWSFLWGILGLPLVACASLGMLKLLT